MVRGNLGEEELKLINAERAISSSILASAPEATVTEHIITASEMVAHYCGVSRINGLATFARRSYVETLFMEHPVQSFTLSNGPAKITEITIGGQSIDVSELMSSGERHFTTTNALQGKLVVSYDAGFVTPAQLTLDTPIEGPNVPRVMQHAVIMVVMSIMKSAESCQDDVIYESHAQEGVSTDVYRYNSDTVGQIIPTKAQNMLKRFKIYDFA